MMDNKESIREELERLYGGATADTEPTPQSKASEDKDTTAGTSLREELNNLYGDNTETTKTEATEDRKPLLDRMALTSSLRDMTTGEGLKRTHKKIENAIVSNPMHLYNYLSEDEEGNSNRGEALRKNIEQNYTSDDDGAFVKAKYDTASKMVDMLPAANDMGDIEVDGYTYPRARVVQTMADVVEETMHPTLMKSNKAYRDNFSIATYGKNFNDYLRERLLALDRSLAKMQQDVNRYVKEDVDAISSQTPIYARGMAGGIDPAIAAAIVTNEKSGGNAIRNTRDKIHSIIDDDFGSGFNESFDWGSMASMGLNDIIAGAELNAVLNKAKDGKELNEREQTVYDVWAINQELDDLRDITGRSGWNNIGSGVGVSADFAPSMMLGTGLLGGGVKLTSLGVRAGFKAAKDAAQKGVMNGIKRGLIETSKVAGRAAANVTRAEAVGIISAPLTPTTWARYAEKRAEQYALNGDKVEYKPTEAWKDVADVMIEQANEVAGELVGGRIADVIGSSAKAFGRAVRLDKLADKMGLSADSRTFLGLRKPAYIREFQRNIGFAGPIAEPLSEVWGDVASNIMKGAITGNSDYSQLATPDYWSQVIGVSTIYGGAVSLATTPASIMEYKRSGIYGVAKARQKALSQIGDDKLRNEMLSISSIEDMDEAARELANISWKDYKRTDVASAMEFIRADYMEKVMLGDAKENVRMSQFEPIALSTSSLVYCGEDGATPTDEIISIDTDMGRLVVRKGVVDAGSDNMLECIDANGKVIPVHASKIKGVYKHSLQEELAANYEKMFGVQIEVDRQNEIVENFKAIKKPTAKDVNIAMSQFGVSERADGDVVTLTDGRTGVINSSMGDGTYAVAVSDYQGTQLLSVPFYDILAEDAKIKDAQMLGYAERMANNIDEYVAGERYEVAKEAKAEEAATRNGITEGDVVATKDGRQGRVIAINDDGTYTIDENVDNISNDLDAAMPSVINESDITTEEEMPVDDIAEETMSAEEDIEATPIEEMENIPTLEDGTIDYNAISDPKVYAKHFANDMGGNEAASAQMASIITATQKEIDGLTAKKEASADPNEAVRNAKAIAERKQRLAFYNEVMNILSPTPSPEVTTVETTTEQPKTTTEVYGIVSNMHSAKLEEGLAKVVDAMAKALGLRVVFTTGLKGDAEIVGNEVRIDWGHRTKAVSFLAGHEFTHRMQDLSPEAYEEFKQSVKVYLGEDEWNRRMVAQARKYRYNRVRYTKGLLEDECIADFAGQLVEGKDVFANYVNKNKENKGLLSVIADVLRAIRDFIFNADAEAAKPLNATINSLESLITESQAAQSKKTENTSTAEQTSQSEGQQKFSLITPEMDADIAEINAERAAIIEAAKANGTYLKAPNGKGTNLTPEQWVDVRTSRFKAWFGDWELANIYRRALEAWDNKDSKGKVAFGLSDRAKARFVELLGKDIKQLVITDDAIRHIKNRHGSNQEQQGQKNMTPEDVVIIPYLINNYDSMELSPAYDDNKGNRAIEIKKRINGVSVVATIERGNNKEFLVTSYQFVKSDALDASNETSGLYVRNDSDIANVQKDIENIKSAATNSSKIVDANGEPKVVYHGTPKGGFTIFDTKPKGKTKDTGAWFASESSNALTYSGRDYEVFEAPFTIEDLMYLIETNEAYKGIRIREVFYIKDEEGNEWKYNTLQELEDDGWEDYTSEDIRKEYILSEGLFDIGTYTDEEVGDMLNEAVAIAENAEKPMLYEVFLNIRDPFIVDAEGKNWQDLELGSTDATAREGRYAGHDGTIIKNVEDGGDVAAYATTDYIVHNPNQIKSATHNVGTYDVNNPDIRFSLITPEMDAYSSASVRRLQEQGAIVDAERGDVKYSLSDILTGEQREQAIADLMRVTGRSRRTVLSYLKAEESLANIILSGDNATFLDIQVDESVPSIWNNSDYPQGTVEFSNICRKRLPYTMIYQRLQKDFPNTVFDAASLESIRQTLIANGVEVACGLCFVEDRRQLLGEIGEGFIKALKGEEVELNDKQEEAIARLRESGDTYIPNLYELITLDGMKILRKEHREVANAFVAYNNARGMQAGRLFQAYSAYHRDILNYDAKRVAKINNAGGLRIFSFSDFEAHHLIDLVQVLTDCAAKGIKVQGYTKVPQFANAVKDTKMKVNRSLIAKGKGVVDADYIPQKGEAVSPNVVNGKRLLFDTVEGIDVNNPNFFDSTDSKNVGNILVGISDEHIRTAMLDPFVDYIIGFHTGLSEAIREQKGIAEWTNYKYTQLEKILKDGKLVNADKHGINIYTEVLTPEIKTERQFVSKYLKVCEERGWIPKYHRFLNKSKSGKFIYTKGYYKLLLDLKMFDANGRILPQEVVVPIFDNDVNARILEEYVEGEKAKAPNDELYGKVVDAMVERGTLTEAQAAEVRNAKTDARYSLIGEMDASYLDAVERGDMATAQRMVMEAAKLAMPNTKVVDEDGNPKVVYHQTNASVYINRETGQNWDELDWRERMEWDERDDWDDYWEEREFNTFSRVNARTTQELDGFFFAPEYDEYHEYGERTISAFLNITNPASREDYDIDSSITNAGREERIRLQNEGYDGVIREEDGTIWEYVAFNPNQIKSADPVTYDDAGNVIPLSERFNPNKEDIRYALMQPTDEEVTFDNFFQNTSAVFEAMPKSEIPQREPDYVSERWDGFGVSSRYWYGEDERGKYVIRESDHWSGYPQGERTREAFEAEPYNKRYTRIASSRWALAVSKEQATTDKETYLDGNKMYGKAYLDEFTKWEGASTPAPTAETQALTTSSAQILGDKNTRHYISDMPFFDEGASEDTEGIEPQRGVITSEEQVRIYLRHKHLKAKQNIRKKYRMSRNTATLDYNERMAERRAKVRSMRTNAGKVEYILGEQIEQTLPFEHQAYAKIARGEIKMPWEALAKELGLKKGEKRMYASITKGADKNTTFDSVVHQWWEELDGYEKGIDTQDLRNALISALSTAPSSTKALTELSEIYNREKERYVELVDDYDRMEEQELIEEDARNASDMERLANDPTSVVAEYTRNASFFNQLEVVDATIMEIRTRLEKTKMMRNYRTKQEYYRTLIDTIAELKQSVKNIITSETIDNLNRNELRRLVDKIDKARSKGDIDSVLNDIDAVMLGALIKAQLKNANRMLKLKLPNGMFAEEWINTQVREGRMSRADADAMLREKWKGRNASGVSVAKWVDARTAEVLDRLSRRVASKMALGDKEFSSEREIEEIANRIAELEDKKIDTERGALPAAEGFTEKDAIELDVLSLYEKFLAADVLRKDVAFLMDVRSEIEQPYYGIEGKEAERDVHLEANQQEINDINRQRKDLLEEFNDSLLSILRGGREALTQFRREQEAHKAMVVNMALDAIGEDARLVKTQPKWNEKMQARLRATVNAPYYTFQTVLKEIDHLSPNGEGRFYNYFMESWRDANNAMIDKHASHVETVAYAMARILKVKGRNAADVIQSIINKSDEAPLLTITYGGDDAMSGAKRETKVLTLSNALYLMAMWRQTQYRDSMMYHGFTEQMYRQVEAAVRGVGEEYITFIDWVNETLLPNTRLEYNKVHKEMFGTSMAEEKNYFPARLVGTVEKGAIDFNEAGKLPSTITGAVISRVRNRNMIDLNVNYFKILMSHLQEMDQWSSFAPLIRDLNYLAANNKFRDKCNSYMCGINADRGGAGSLFTYFKLTSAIAANCYTPPKVNPVESAILALTRGWAGANISWRFSTALKQLASSPVFAVYSTDPRCAALWAKNSAATFAQQKATLEWAMRVSPMFKKRWEGKFAGMDILDSKVKENGEYSNISVWNQTKVGRGVAKFDDALHKFATDLGMTPNAFVDAMTVANGIKTIYEYEISKWKRQNKGKEVPRNVERKAIMKAEIAFNATQQSSEGAFISEWQAERGIMRALSTYQNSAYGFHRLRLTAANELWRQINNEEYKKRLIEEYGEVEAKAILKDARKTAYAQLMQGSIGEFIFAMMGGAGAVPLFRLLGGDDDEGESWDLFKDAMAGALLNISTGGYALGSLLNSALSGYEVTLFTAGDEFIKDVKELFSTPSLYKALEMLGKYRYGVDLQTFTNIATGIDGLIDKASYDDGGAEAVMKILNIPRTQIDMVAGKRKDGETVQEYVTRRLRTEAIGAIPEVDAEGNIIVDDEYWNKFYTPRKSYAQKYRKDFEIAYRRDVITNIAGVDAYRRYLELEDEYKAVVEAIGWTPDTKPSSETYKKIVTMGGFDDATYKALFPLQKEVAFKVKKAENFVGTEDNYYELLEQMMESKQKLIDKYNEL